MARARRRSRYVDTTRQAVLKKVYADSLKNRWKERLAFVCSFILLIVYAAYAAYLLFYETNVAKQIEEYLLRIPLINRLVDLELFADDTLRKGYLIFFLTIIISWCGAAFFRADSFLYSRVFRIVLGILYFVVGIAVLAYGVIINLDEFSLISIKDWLSTNDTPQFMWIKSLTMAFALGMNYFFAYWQATDTTRYVQEMVLGREVAKWYYTKYKENKVLRVKFHAPTCWNFIMTTTVAFATMIVFGQTVSVVASVLSIVLTTSLGLYSTHKASSATRDRLVDWMNEELEKSGEADSLRSQLIGEEVDQGFAVNGKRYEHYERRQEKKRTRNLRKQQKKQRKNRAYYDEYEYEY